MSKSSAPKDSQTESGSTTSSDRPSDAAPVDPTIRVQLATDEIESLVRYVDTPAVADSPQRKRTEHELQPTLVRASAGTGKTYRLTARLLKIFLQGAAPETILATTFTRKAAGEILDRLLSTLASAADENNEQALVQLREQVGIPTLPRSACLQLLTTLLRNVHRLRVCTLDSLFAQLARSFPFELGLPPAWRLTDEIEESWLKERAVDSVIATLDQTEMTAVLSMLGKGEVKRSIARELLQVVDSAYAAQRQCDPNVWSSLVAPARPEPSVLSHAAEMMRTIQPKQKRSQSRLEKAAASIETLDFGPLVHDTLISNIALARRTGGKVMYYRSAFPEGLDEAFDILYAAVRTHALSLLQAQNEATGTVLAAYDAHVTALKRASRALGFDDVAVRLATEFATLDHRAIGARMDGAIDHVLLDEFQDTSPAQWQVLRPIVSRVAAWEPDEQNDQWKVERSFFCVGDTKQAIYGWRGGVAEIFDAVADQIDGVHEEEQNTSYRSSPVVIDVINRTFRNLPRHPKADALASGDPTDKDMYEASAIHDFAKRFPEHNAHRQELAGHVRVVTCPRLDQSDADARRLACFEEAARITAGIHQRSANSSIGVLMRTNQGVAQLIYLLEELGVDVSQEGGNPLTDSAAVELVLSSLMMAEHPGDGRWRFHLGGSPLAEVPNMGANLIRRMVEDQGIAETIEFLGGKLAPACGPRETLRLKQLAHLAIEYQSNAAPRLRDFVRLVREKRIERPQAAAVRVMTIHQAKGLEFDAVVLPELDGQLTRQSGHCVADVPTLGQPPEAMTRYLNHKSWHFLSRHWQRAFGARAAGAVTEALCLLYVAMTRPRQALHLVMQPCKKPSFDNRTAASLVYHALGCEEDPTVGGQTLFEVGDENWMESSDEPSSPPEPVETKPIEIRFQPMPPVARRNRADGE